MLSFLLTSLIRYHEKSPISKKIKTLYHAETLIIEIKFYKRAKLLGGKWESGRNDSGANWKVGETTRGERESGRNDSGANGKVENDPDSAGTTLKWMTIVMRSHFSL